MRAHRYHSTARLVHLYKAKVLSYAEYRTSAIYHACYSTLAKIDKVQTDFLDEIGVSDEDSLMNFNLAPLQLRRDIAMLGLIHRTVLGQGPKHFKDMFFEEVCPNRRCSRRARHKHQLHEHVNGSQLDVLSRSALGLVSVYNLLPNVIVEAPSVKQFQRSLQDFAKDCMQRGLLWKTLFSTCHGLSAHPLLKFWLLA